MSFRYKIRLAGAGSQGLMDSARMLAEAAAIYEDLYAAESCSFGPEARGRTCKADIIVSDEVIESPGTGPCDLLLVLNRESCEAYLDSLKTDGLLLAERSALKGSMPEGARHKVFSLAGLEGYPAKVKHLNIIVLGIISEVCDVIGERAIRKSIVARSPKTLERVCIESFEIGLGLVPADEQGCPGRKDEGGQA